MKTIFLFFLCPTISYFIDYYYNLSLEGSLYRSMSLTLSNSNSRFFRLSCGLEVKNTDALNFSPSTLFVAGDSLVCGRYKAGIAEGKGGLEGLKSDRVYLHKGEKHSISLDSLLERDGPSTELCLVFSDLEAPKRYLIRAFCSAGYEFPLLYFHLNCSLLLVFLLLASFALKWKATRPKPQIKVF